MSIRVQLYIDNIINNIDRTTYEMVSECNWSSATKEITQLTTNYDWPSSALLLLYSPVHGWNEINANFIADAHLKRE